jgi:hypothetical protein
MEKTELNGSLNKKAQTKRESILLNLARHYATQLLPFIFRVSHSLRRATSWLLLYGIKLVERVCIEMQMLAHQVGYIGVLG